MGVVDRSFTCPTGLLNSPLSVRMNILQGQKPLSDTFRTDAGEAQSPASSNSNDQERLPPNAAPAIEAPMSSAPFQPALASRDNVSSQITSGSKRKADWRPGGERDASARKEAVSSAFAGSGQSSMFVGGTVGAAATDLERVRAALLVAQRQAAVASSDGMASDIQLAQGRASERGQQDIAGLQPGSLPPMVDTQLIFRATNLATAAGLPLNTSNDLRVALQLLAAAEAAHQPNQPSELQNDVRLQSLASSLGTTSHGHAEAAQSHLLPASHHLLQSLQHQQQQQRIMAGRSDDRLAALTALHKASAGHARGGLSGLLAHDAAAGTQAHTRAGQQASDARVVNAGQCKTVGVSGVSTVSGGWCYKGPWHCVAAEGAATCAGRLQGTGVACRCCCTACRCCCTGGGAGETIGETEPGAEPVIDVA